MPEEMTGPDPRKEFEHLAAYSALMQHAEAFMEHLAHPPQGSDLRMHQSGILVEKTPAGGKLAFRLTFLGRPYDLQHTFVWLQKSWKLGLHLWVGESFKRQEAGITIRSDCMAAISPLSREFDHSIANADEKTIAGKIFLRDFGMNGLIGLDEKLI